MESELEAPWGMTSFELGRAGERASGAYLTNHGYEVLERNWRCEAGEVDIVAKDPSGEHVLVEVKTRLVLGGEAVWPELAVGEAKLRKYRTLSQVYMGSHPLVETLRLDVIGVTVVGPGHAQVRHLRDVWLGE